MSQIVLRAFSHLTGTAECACHYSDTSPCKWACSGLQIALSSMMLIMSQMIPSVCFADCNQPTPRMFQVLLNSMHLPANGTCFSPHPSVVPADAISAAGFGSRAAAAEAGAQYGAPLPPPAVLAGLQQQVPVSHTYRCSTRRFERTSKAGTAGMYRPNTVLSTRTVV